jgi:putative transposase
MPREARFVMPGMPLHIVQRGINRDSCFFSEADYGMYLHFLGSSAARFGCAIHAYCLMSNHVHLLITPHTPDACGAFMKHLGQCYVQAVNKRLNRSGTLWEGRFRSSLVQSDSYVLACYRYIELNPVRAGMVSSPAEYWWSSYATNAEGKENALLQSHPAYESLGQNCGQRAEAYKELCADALPATDVEQIRKATSVGCVVGTPRRQRGRPFMAK